jgi:hypothetical protein
MEAELTSIKHWFGNLYTDKRLRACLKAPVKANILKASSKSPSREN